MSMPLISDQAMDVDSSPATQPDNRFNDEGRKGRRRNYSFETGYHEELPENIWPECFTRNHNGVYCDFNEWSKHPRAPRFNMQDCVYLPFPWTLPSLKEKLDQRSNQIQNIVAGLNPLPFYVYTPPVLMMLHGIKADEPLTDEPEFAPVELSTRVMLVYQKAIHVMQAQKVKSKDDPSPPLTAAQLNKIIKVHEEKIEDHCSKLVSYMGTNADYKIAAKRYAEVGVLGPMQGAEEERILNDFVRHLVSWVINHLRIMERRILYLTGYLNPDDLPENFLIEAALPAPTDQKLASFMDATALATETSMYLKLAHQQRQQPLPVIGNGFDMSHTIHGISVQAVRVLLLLNCLDD